MAWKQHLKGLTRFLARDRRAKKANGGSQAAAWPRARLDLELLERRDVLAVLYRTGDFSGDGIPDLAQLDVPNRRVLLTYWNGVSGAVPPASQIPKINATSLPTWKEFLVADVNGDGKADLVGRHYLTGKLHVAISTVGSFAFPNWQGVFSPSVNWADMVVGDFNGDRRQDVAGRNPTTGNWQVALSTGTQFVTADWGGGWGNLPRRPRRRLRRRWSDGHCRTQYLWDLASLPFRRDEFHHAAVLGDVGRRRLEQRPGRRLRRGRQGRRRRPGTEQHPTLCRPLDGG